LRDATFLTGIIFAAVHSGLHSPKSREVRGVEAFKSHQITGFLDVAVSRRNSQASEVG
jgi:hypothetical protein